MVSIGDTVELVSTSDPYTNLTPGDRGEVTDISTTPAMGPNGRPETQIWIDWEAGSSLALIQGEDRFKVLPDEATE
jgi:hypothetical protein